MNDRKCFISEDRFYIWGGNIVFSSNVTHEACIYSFMNSNSETYSMSLHLTSCFCWYNATYHHKYEGKSESKVPYFIATK